MPIYTISHVFPLSEDQEQALAQGITHLHSRRFHTPSLFVNVVFTDISQGRHYVAGKKRKYNMINASVRQDGRSREDFDELTKDVMDLWTKAVQPKGAEQELRAVFVTGTLLAGSEAGFSVPRAGEDVHWLHNNRAEFAKRAEAGDEDFVDLMKELNEREDLARK